jgi:hypothetical protein
VSLDDVARLDQLLIAKDAHVEGEIGGNKVFDVKWL